MALAPNDENQDPNAQMVDPQVGDEEMDAFLKSLEEGFEYAPNIDLSTFAPKGDTGDEPDDDANPHPDETDDDDDPANPPAPEAGSDDDIEINGQKWAKSEIQRLMDFDKFLRENPDKAQRVAQAITDGQPPVSATTPPTPTSDPVAFVPPTPPEDVDLDDPTTKFMWDNLVESRKEAFELKQAQAERDARYAADQQAISQRRVQEDMNTALTQFREQFPNLNDDDIALIRNEAGPLVGGYMATMPPVEALKRSMEVAGYANTDLRAKLLDSTVKTPTNASKSATRKRKLGAVSGTPRSAPKVDSRPQYNNDREMVQGFADALAEAGLGR